MCTLYDSYAHSDQIYYREWNCMTDQLALAILETIEEDAPFCITGEFLYRNVLSSEAANEMKEEIDY